MEKSCSKCKKSFTLSVEQRKIVKVFVSTKLLCKECIKSMVDGLTNIQKAIRKSRNKTNKNK